jgi:glycosyltransferase 2 family protein
MSIKKVLRWLIIGAVLFFLLKTLHQHWQEVSQIRITAAGWATLTIAIGTILFAHLLAGYVWGWILKGLGQSVTGAWAARTYLKTNMAKYLPGNIWHFYGRVNAAKQLGISVGTATLSILMEPLLMAAAACLLASASGTGWTQIAIAIAILCGIHPRILNPVLNKVGKSKLTEPMKLERYPIIPFLGELGFLGVRSLGFVITFAAIVPFSIAQLPVVVGSFAWAWLVGLVTPGLPGGVGVFEAVAIALLGQQFSPGQVLSVVAVYRLVNTIAEGLGAGLAILDDR